MNGKKRKGGKVRAPAGPGFQKGSGGSDTSDCRKRMSIEDKNLNRLTLNGRYIF